MIEIRADGVYQDGIKIGETAREAAWNQGILELYGIRQQMTDSHTCPTCGWSYSIRRMARFVEGAGAVVEYVESPDPGCPRKDCKP